MALAAFITPSTGLDDETIDRVVRRVVSEGFVPCNPPRGASRIVFFPLYRIPSGWRRIGVVSKEPPCAA